MAGHIVMTVVKVTCCRSCACNSSRTWSHCKHVTSIKYFLHKVHTRHPQYIHMLHNGPAYHMLRHTPQ